MNKRPRARYSINASLTVFLNPSRNGPVDRVSFCVVDTMYHIFFRYDPLRSNDNFYSIGKKIREANIRQNGTDPSPAVTKYSDDDFLMSVWFPGNIDFEDIVAIVGGVPELKADWLRPEFEKLKITAGLGRNDPPLMDRDWNEEDKTNWYKGGWFSAKGGTLELAEMPESLCSVFGEKASLEPAVRGLNDMQTLRFSWKRPQKGPRESIWAVRKLVAEV